MTVRPTAGDTTRIEARVRRGDAAAITYVLTGIGWLVGASLLGDVIDPNTTLEILAYIGGSTAGAYATARTIWSRLMGGWQDRVDRLMDRLTEV
ncbi:MAG: hypothetical protein GWN02_35365, partial [Gemmatimonadetes bacterium]|nr:hypothetical protein [Gemmatimonadota bacterium]NIY13231.1 hypothetical protein [Gemmatimonadota bacterium]